MEEPHSEELESPLLLPSLRLFIPPLRLVSAALWQVIQRGDLHDYGMLEEFVNTVTEIVPELLNPDQKAQLLLGLRAKVVLDLCRAEQVTELETINMHLDRIKTLISTWASQPCFAEVEFPESNFVDQVNTLLKDPTEKEKFFQDIFPVAFGSDYDSALQMLMLDFLSRLEKLIPVPDLQETASMLSAVPSALEECVQSVPDPQQLKTVLQYHTMLGHLGFIDETQSVPSSFGNCILSSLSLPQLEKVVIDTEHLQLDSTEQTHSCMTVQVDGQTVTLLDYIQIEQTAGFAAEPDSVGFDAVEEEEEEEVPESDVARKENTASEDEALTPAPFQPLKQSKRLQLKRKVLNDKRDSGPPVRRKKRRKYPDSKTCPVCSKSFLRATAMRRHLEIHSENRQLKYKCPVCDKRFRDQYDMTRHSMRVHESGENDDDEEEEEGAGQDGEDAAERHGDAQSPDSKNCFLCGKYFARRVDMERHMRSHSDDRPYKCAYCEKRFKHLYVLRRHQKDICKSKHLKNVGAAAAEEGAAGSSGATVDGKLCPICSRLLPCTADMAKHLRSHTEERPFVCLSCEKGFKYKDTLKKHQIIHGHEGVREEESKTVEQILAEAGLSASGDGLENREVGADLAEPLYPQQQQQLRKKSLTVCPVCARAFDGVKTLNKHMQCHTDDRPYHCVHCKRRFKHVHGLKRHQIYAICHKKIARVISAAKKDPARPAAGRGGSAAEPHHQGATTLNIPVWCSNCGKHFEHLAALREHQDSVCKVEFKDVLTCADCRKDFSSMTMLKVHRRIHDPLYCNECGKILASQDAFERHKLMHKPIQCTMCDKTFTLLRRLREHYKKQHNFSGPYPCVRCDKTFSQLSYLAIHERVHNGEFPYACNACPEKFRSSNCLTVHQRKHTGEKPFLCWQCGKCYRSASELTVHMGTHSDERPWACSQCDMAYRTKLQLTSHVEQVHIGLRYPCTACGKQFMKEMSLKRHELIHTGERPHQCTECGKTFLTANELRLHNRYHTGERPYKCDVCGKAFIQSGYLKSHMRIHTGEKPFKCDVCEKAFRLSYHMKKHRRTHSGKSKVKGHVCEECGLVFTHKKSLTEHAAFHQANIVPPFTREVRIEFH